ncbi:MAG: hypothetical protein IJT82_08780 [Schwartzia sp.]|nr:hypothetical protein [Schwartzia sp. (in: firmicutes)]
MPPITIILGLVVVIGFSVLLGFHLLMMYYFMVENDDIEWLSRGSIRNQTQLLVLNVMLFFFVVVGFVIMSIEVPTSLGGAPPM